MIEKFNKLKTIKISKKTRVKIYLLLIFISMLILNLLTPLIADDYTYSLNLNNEHLESINDILLFQINHYCTWGGRTIAHTIAQIFLLFPKYIFSVFNALAYTILINLMYRHAKQDKEDKPSIIILLHLMIFNFLPVFGQTTIWLIGSCNYLWTTTIMVFFLLQYRNNINDTKLRNILMFLLGIIAGWSNENTAVGLIIITALLVLLLNFKVIKGKKIEFKFKKYQIFGLLGAITGFIIMIAAPGNYARNALFVEETPFIIKILKRTIECTKSMYSNIMPLIIVGIILMTITIYNKRKINPRVWIYIIGAFFSIYAMVMAPYFAERSWFGIVIFLLIAYATLAFEMDTYQEIYKYIFIDIIIIGTLFFVKDYYLLASDINNLRNVWKERINTIKESNKKETYEFSIYTTENKKNPNFGIVDLVTDDSWPNNSIALYYDIDTIKGK